MRENADIKGLAPNRFAFAFWRCTAALFIGTGIAGFLVLYLSR